MDEAASLGGTQQAGAMGLGVRTEAAGATSRTGHVPSAEMRPKEEEQVWGKEGQGWVNTWAHSEPEFPEAQDSPFLETDTVTLCHPLSRKHRHSR